jgi:hypothetical protein
MLEKRYLKKEQQLLKMEAQEVSQLLLCKTKQVFIQNMMLMVQMYKNT